MSRIARFGWILAIFLAVGCTKDEAYLEVAREQRGAWKEMTEILETVKDEKSMEAAKALIQEKQAKFEAISKKARALPRPSAEVLSRLEEDKYLIEQTLKRLGRESERVSKLPGGQEFMEKFQSSSQGLMSAVKR